ncbi:MAG TPA: DNA mismatch repair endonuclease MutL [Levilinea sp.]|nr:DNA mismatch repair endonuclease MutL [Levilinea sp.]
MIAVLADEVASQIAAGEVVERPASVVKELLENALDAQAGKVVIHVEKAGRRKIIVADDGGGIPAVEIRLAVARHATSKLHSAEDLFRIVTLGFRGEALASIGSVSRLTLTSRARGAEIGARMLVEGGSIIHVEQAGLPEGTVVQVEDIFYNVPARLKFLKQDVTERRQIDALVTRYAMAYPAVRIHLFHDGAPVLQTSGNGDRREVLANLYGIETARQMLEVALQEEEMRVTGFISPVSLTRSNRREITFFVNGRWVQDASLATALLQAYRTLLMVGRFPLAVLHLELPVEMVDVNVHPAKSEVRFNNPDRIFATVQRAVRRGLLAHSPVPNLSMPSWQPQFSGDSTPGAHWDMAAQVGDEHQAPTGDTRPAGSATVQLGSGDGTALQASSLPLLRLVGQIGATYLVAEGPDGLYLIDQHAAHERVLYERFMRLRNTSIPGQTLLEPVTFQLSPAAASQLAGQIETLSKLGFRVEPFGPNIFQVRAIPAILAGSDPVAAVRVVVEDFEEDEAPLRSEIEALLVARICKRVAVKGGQTLSVGEQQSLLRDLENCSSPRTCPHGRPTMIHLSVDLLERQFGRRGSR